MGFEKVIMKKTTLNYITIMINMYLSPRSRAVRRSLQKEQQKHRISHIFMLDSSNLIIPIHSSSIKQFI